MDTVIYELILLSNLLLYIILFYTNSFKSSDTYYYSTSLSQDIISMKNRGVKYDE